MVKRLELGGVKPLRNYFREWRQFAGLTQQALGDKIGMAAGTISRIETGKRDFNGRFLALFVDAVGCPQPGDPLNREPDTISLDSLTSDRELRKRAAELMQILLNATNGKKTIE